MGAVPAPAQEPCRICDDMKEFLAKRGFKLPPPAQDRKVDADATGHEGKAGDDAAHRIVDCPLDRATLGRYSWAMLHTMAAYYPTTPTRSEQSAMSEFMARFAQFYPCATCAHHLRFDLRSYPPETGSRHLLSQWMCRLHNRVNRRLGKPLFDCAKVDERWRTGPPC